jgi:hypothetical protein
VLAAVPGGDSVFATATRTASGAPARLLYPAGRILHVVWDANEDALEEPPLATEPANGVRPRGVARLPRIEAAEARAPPPWRQAPEARVGCWALYDHVPAERYGRLLLSRRMLLDHFLPTIGDQLLGVMAQLGVPPPDLPLEWDGGATETAT